MSSKLSGQLPLLIVQRTVALLPAAMPVIVVVGLPALVTVAVPLSTLQVPTPTAGVFAAITITGIAAGSSATVRWTISNGSCPDSFEDIVLTNQQSPSASSAGTDQEQCGSGAFTLAGNVPTVGTGVWSIVGAANGAVITTPGTATSGVTGLNAGSSVVLRWTISNGLCPDELDEVTLTNTANPTTSDAGVDLDQCDNGIFTMAANTPAVGVGTWSVESGTATVTNAVQPNDYDHRHSGRQQCYGTLDD